MTQDPRTVWSDAEPDDEVGAEFFRPRAGEARTAVPCPPPELVQASRAGTLSPDLQQRLAGHLERCVVCQALIEALDDSSVGSLTPEEHERILQRVRAEVGESKRGVAGNRWWQLSAAAAGIALVAIGAVLVWQSSSAPSAPVPPPVAQDILLPAPPVFRLEKPELRGSVVTEPLGRRSTQSGERAELSRSLQPYRANDFAEVARRLSAFVRRHPQSAAGHFYLGISNLFLYRDADAVSALETAERLAKNDIYLLHETAWYLALAYRRTGQVEHAQARLDALCRGKSMRSARACAGLREVAIRHRLSGGVTAADGTPLSGASVGEYLLRWETDFIVGFPTRFSANTGGDGRYSVSGTLVSPSSQMMVRAAKPGYFTVVTYVPVSQEMHVDLTLDPWVHISLGEVVRGTIKAGDAIWGDPTQLCQRFALTVPANGTLEVSVAAANRAEFDVYVETPNGEVFGPLPRAPLRIAVPAVAMSTYQIRVLRFADGPREFELTTRLR